MIIKKCPRCKSTKIVFDYGIITGLYFCRSCGYSGPIILEEEIKVNK